MRSIRVLGVDPGLTRCGIGVVDSAGGRLALVEFDVLRTPSDADIGTRLLALEVAIEAWIARHSPDVVAVERVVDQFAHHGRRPFDDFARSDLADQFVG